MSDWVRITVTRTQGSVPREAGTQMRVWADRTEGTIGGGALEWEAMRIARQMLREETDHQVRTLPLGPTLGQCCGGAVSLRWDRAECEPEVTSPVWVWGAGHVGRAVVDVLSPLPQVTVSWIDTDPERFPEALPEGIEQIVAADPPLLTKRVPTAAHHLVMTYSHDIDLALCDGLLTRGFASCGLIGSATKRARFRARLRDLGHSDATISGIRCPIGQPELGKHPQAIAIGVVAELVSTLETTATLDDTGT